MNGPMTTRFDENAGFMNVTFRAANSILHFHTFSLSIHYCTIGNEYKIKENKRKLMKMYEMKV